MKTFSLGQQYLAEFYGCNAESICTKEQLRTTMLEAAQIARATIVADVFHEFNPHGLSGVVVIAESHLAVHSWPEYACASVDLFTCSQDMDPEAAIAFLKTAFQAERVEIQILKRGKISRSGADAPARERIEAPTV